MLAPQVYTVGPDYAHAEARKSPALDGKVERDSEGKEIRYPVMLSAMEKLVARKVCLAFKVRERGRFLDAGTQRSTEPSTGLSVRLCLTVCPCLSFCRSVCLSLSDCLSLSVFLSDCRSVCLSVSV